MMSESLPLTKQTNTQNQTAIPGETSFEGDVKTTDVNYISTADEQNSLSSIMNKIVKSLLDLESGIPIDRDQIGSDLVGPVDSWFGSASQLNDSGSRIVIGAYIYNTATGLVQVYEENNKLG